MLTLAKAAKSGWQFESDFKANSNGTRYLRALTPNKECICLYGTGSLKGLSVDSVKSLAGEQLTELKPGVFAIGVPTANDFGNPFA